MSGPESGYTGRNDRLLAFIRGRGRERRGKVDILIELVKAAITLGVLAAIIIILAGLFIVILSLATGIDDHVQPGEDGR